jgi:hypothetical protein
MISTLMRSRIGTYTRRSGTHWPRDAPSKDALYPRFFVRGPTVRGHTVRGHIVMTSNNLDRLMKKETCIDWLDDWHISWQGQLRRQYILVNFKNAEGLDNMQHQGGQLRQTSSWADRQLSRCRQLNRHAAEQTCSWTDMQLNRQAAEQTGSWTERQLSRQASGQTGSWADRQLNRRSAEESRRRTDRQVKRCGLGQALGRQRDSQQGLFKYSFKKTPSKLIQLHIQRAHLFLSVIIFLELLLC